MKIKLEYSREVDGWEAWSTKNMLGEAGFSISKYPYETTWTVVLDDFESEEAVVKSGFPDVQTAKEWGLKTLIEHTEVLLNTLKTFRLD